MNSYWNTTRNIDISTAPFTYAAIVRSSDNNDATIAILVDQIANNQYVKAALVADSDGGKIGMETLRIAVANLIRRGIKTTGYLKVSVEKGTREMWLDM